MRRKMKKMKPKLLDVEEEHRKNPRTYSIPRKEQRHHLQVGQLVKLVFLKDSSETNDKRAERMWVIVKKILEDGYCGTLDNDPYFLAGLKRGDLIDFGPEHVAAIDLSQEGLEIPYDKFAVINKEVWNGDRWPNRLEHHPPPDDQFSGWWIYSGSEKEEDKEDWRLFIPESIVKIIEKYRILDTVLDEPVGTQWIWDDENLEYRQV
jgi:hypothetical protein